MMNEKEYSKVVAQNFKSNNRANKKKPRRAPNRASYGVFYCRQRGSNPHKVGVYTYVYAVCAEIHSNPTKKSGASAPPI